MRMSLRHLHKENAEFGILLTDMAQYYIVACKRYIYVMFIRHNK